MQFGTYLQKWSNEIFFHASFKQCTSRCCRIITQTVLDHKVSKVDICAVKVVANVRHATKFLTSVQKSDTEKLKTSNAKTTCGVKPSFET